MHRQHFGVGGLAASAARNFLRRSMPAYQEGMTAIPNLPGALSVVKNRGGNWLPGSVEDALRGLKKPVQELHPYVDQATAAQINSINAPINAWIEGPLTKYVKTRMASPDDEVRKLAEQGVLHFAPNPIDFMRRNAGYERQKWGYPPGGVAKNPLAKDWEDASDAQIEAETARDWAKNVPSRTLTKIPGFEKIPESEAIWETISPALTQNLGFYHLIDELSNALNPQSGLPRNLQLTPEAMKQMSMEKAVRRVADINAWRAAQKVEANRKLAEQASLVREYTENNPKGLRWVELKQQEGLPPGYRMEPSASGVMVDVIGPGGRWAANNEKEAAEKAWGAARANGYNPLGDQLKYEGDTMGHCVGGHCDDVLSGRSRIFSLRDAKGEPHVTVEVDPGQKRSFRSNLDVARLTPEERALFEAYEGPLKHNYPEQAGIVTPERLQELYDTSNVPSIIQIKGKQNKAPNAEYLPFVQDFVRNSPLGSLWSDVGDLRNTGLTKTAQGYFTQEELEQMVRDTIDRGPTKFASGGGVRKQVRTVAELSDIIAALEAA